jgi:Leucine-rich repeat (LRR) protein
MVENDEDAVTLDEFTIPLNPISTDSISYGWTDDNGHIHHLKIIDKKFISPMIFRLKYLKRLDIRNTCFFSCDLLQVPPDIQCLASSLIDLSIYNTKITHLPNEIGKLERLQILKVSNTDLISLPDTIKNLRSLQIIILTDNPYLYSIEPLNGLPFLSILDTSRCSVEFLPKNLPQLTDLYMSNNKLKKLIGLETLGNGTKAEKDFRFDMNSIDFVSPTIRDVKNLVRLRLNDNRLKSLPLDIFEIPTLQRLSYHNNSLNENQLKKLSMKFNNTFRLKSKN